METLVLRLYCTFCPYLDTGSKWHLYQSMEGPQISDRLKYLYILNLL